MRIFAKGEKSLSSLPISKSDLTVREWWSRTRLTNSFSLTFWTCLQESNLNTRHMIDSNSKPYWSWKLLRRKKNTFNTGQLSLRRQELLQSQELKKLKVNRLDNFPTFKMFADSEFVSVFLFRTPVSWSGWSLLASCWGWLWRFRLATLSLLTLTQCLSCEKRVQNT